MLEHHITSKTLSPFPLEKFLEENSIKYIPSWKGYKCNDQTHNTTCNCNDGCQASGDCCIDFLWKRDETNEFNIHKYAEKISMSMKKEFSCLPLFPFTSLQEHFIMVDSCLPGADEVDVRKCKSNTTLQNEDQVPVMGDDHFLYKNKFCAKCNLVNKYDFTGFELYCNWYHNKIIEPNGTVLEILQDKQCSITAVPGYQMNVLKCIPHLCSHDDMMFCRTFAAHLPDYYTMRYSVKNIYCHKCLLKYPVSCIGYACPPVGVISKYSYTWSSRFDLNEIFPQSKEKCVDDKIDDGNGNCIDKRCGLRYNLQNSKCKELQSEDNLSGKYTNVDFGTNFIVQKCFREKNIPLAMFAFVHLSNPQNRYNKTSVTIFLEKLTRQWIVAYQNTTLIVYKSVHLTKNVDIKYIIHSIANMFSFNVVKIVLATEKHLQTSLYGFDLTRTFQGPRLCSSVRSMTNLSKVYNKSYSCNKLMKDLFNLSTTIISDQGTTINHFNFNLVFKNEGVVEQWAYYCQQFHLDSDCFHKDVYPDVFTVDDNKTLYFEISSKVFIAKANEYIPTSDGRFQVCIGKVNNEEEVVPWLGHVLEAKYLISVIGTALSVFAYLLIILTFALIPELQNVGGTYVLVLVILLLISDIIFISILVVIVRNTLECKWSGLVLHWMMLSICVWSIVIAIDITLKFSTKSSNVASRSTNNSLYRRLVMTMILTTGVMVLVIALNETDTLNFDYDQTCWIGNFYLKLAFFFIPTSVSYLVCILCLILILNAIKESADETRQSLKDCVNRNHGINIAKIGIKLMIVLGISESIGLIQIRSTDLTENELIVNNFFGVFYDILRSLRGVLIFVVFLRGNRTSKLIQKKLNLKKLSRVELTGTTYL